MTVGIERRSVYRVASELRLAESVSEPAATPVLHTVHLAQYVFKAFCLSEGGVEAIGDAVVGR